MLPLYCFTVCSFPYSTSEVLYKPVVSSLNSETNFVSSSSPEIEVPKRVLYTHSIFLFAEVKKRRLFLLCTVKTLYLEGRSEFSYCGTEGEPCISRHF